MNYQARTDISDMIYDYGCKMLALGNIQAEQNEYKENTSLYFELGDNARRTRREAADIFDLIMDLVNKDDES